MRFKTEHGSAISIDQGPTGVWFKDFGYVRVHFVHRNDLHKFIQILQEIEREFDRDSQAKLAAKQSKDPRDGAERYGEDYTEHLSVEAQRRDD